MKAFGISSEKALIRTPDVMGVVRRYHAPLRPAYDQTPADTYRHTSDQEYLQITVFAINCMVDP